MAFRKVMYEGDHTMKEEIFKPALDAISDRNLAIFGPTSFQGYLRKYNLPSTSTARSISIDSYERLPSILKKNHTMVLRLGSSLDRKGTQFALVKVKDHLDDFFLIDHEIFTNKEGSTFLPAVNMRQLFAYQVLPAFSETSLVNLGLASGLVSCALGIDKSKTVLAPATGRSTFTFRLRAHSHLQEVLIHNRGQVEIDALFVETRGGKETLFVLEAKKDKDASLAKHKLVYPLLAVANHVPKDISIVPVYMKVLRCRDGLHFHVIECEFPDPRRNLRAISDLMAKNHSHLILPTVGGNL